MVPITNGSGIFRLFFLNFLLFNYVDEFFKFFNCFLFISLKQKIKVSTVRRGEFGPVASLIRKRQVRLFLVIFGHKSLLKIPWGQLFASPGKLFDFTILKTFWINILWKGKMNVSLLDRTAKNLAILILPERIVLRVLMIFSK